MSREPVAFRGPCWANPQGGIETVLIYLTGLLKHAGKEPLVVRYFNKATVAASDAKASWSLSIRWGCVSSI